MSRLILASRSPRRVELLQRFGIPFSTWSPDVDESCSLPAGEAVKTLSRRKASAAAQVFPDSFILAADTLVSIDGLSLGKPRNQEEAAAMLRRLSGRTHQVYTGVTVINPSGEEQSGIDRTDVTFITIPDKEILTCVRSGEPMDKAGGYALQGQAGMWINRIEGSDSSVIGLPLYLVRSLLLASGFPLFSDNSDDTKG